MQTGQRQMAVKRRPLHLSDVAELRTEVEAICTRPVRTLGNWTEAQIVQHVARMMEFAYAGFPFKASRYVRPVARLYLPRLLRKGFTPSFRLPERARALLPDDAVSLAQAAAQMGAVLGRLDRGEPMTQPHPLFGVLSPEQWVQLHLRHAEHHFSFVILEMTI